MTRQEIKAFKRHLKKHYYFYICKVNDLHEDIEILYWQMSGDKGLDYTKLKGQTNQQAINNYKLTLSEQIETLEQEAIKYEQKLLEIENVLNKMVDVDREMFRLKYLKHMSYMQIGEKFYLSTSAVYKQMEKALEKI